jgi:hypothetical protein
MTEARIMSCPKALSTTRAPFWHVKALQEVQVLVLAGGAFEEVIVHHCDPSLPTAICKAASGRPRPYCMRRHSRPLQRLECIKSTRFSVHSITTVPGFRLSLHIGCRIPAASNLYLGEQTLCKLEEIGLWYSPINVWVQQVDCELFRGLAGADCTTGRSRAPHGA